MYAYVQLEGIRDERIHLMVFLMQEDSLSEPWCLKMDPLMMMIWAFAAP